MYLFQINYNLNFFVLEFKIFSTVQKKSPQERHRSPIIMKGFAEAAVMLACDARCGPREIGLPLNFGQELMNFNLSVTCAFYIHLNLTILWKRHKIKLTKKH